MNKREEMIEELQKMCQVDGFITTTPERLSAFILEDRKRICAPLVSYMKDCKISHYLRDTSEYGPDPRLSSLFIAGEETLKNAGIE